MIDISVLPVTDADVEAIIDLARVVWYDTYPAIISRAQIEFMLAQRYTAARIRGELQQAGIWWDQAHVGTQLAGFACSLLTANHELKLDKIYVDPQHQGAGVGARLIAQVAEHARAAACTTLILAVNKHNERAIAAYRRHGFVVREAVCVDIGGGFVMDDFIMAKSLDTSC
ncbi:MAG TPA: GNAT family N-acetyltransferase [Accumulibacter sp.]|uniref:GNAT family N-acetyltransferase n=2 Tax=Accumulibacter sp. TaxID=2053492 RepID=UPI00262757A7|nr:GNAT family N-acetyltransferase [Accumulibacter sp.]MDS4054708.1 GNAT family N-acetyltransferase [Accumulibacter sp.]HMV05292.1 GNAT family N-acetyltransferase [Accumulibacter sp.]HMW64619.1 GNAT family N-acetyltransferase [Accumulibacter sp.]HMW81912.1 GNAT family N-acetyltransferase [Accumulibacter sp.]HNB68879.1 GNAT family N-acetyltransferase [Accumulibacter sp.]